MPLPLSRRGFGAMLAGLPALSLPALSACAHFPRLPDGGPGDPIEAAPVYREAASAAPVLPGNRLDLLFDGLQAFTALFDVVAAARDHVNLEFYIMQDVSVPGTDGPSLFTLLRETLRQGVAVTLLYDSFGSDDTPNADFDALRAAGATLLSFNPVNPFEARGGWRPNRHDHRKLLVADGRVALIRERSGRRAAGGRGIGSGADRAVVGARCGRCPVGAARSRFCPWLNTDVKRDHDGGAVGHTILEQAHRSQDLMAAASGRICSGLGGIIGRRLRTVRSPRAGSTV